MRELRFLPRYQASNIGRSDLHLSSRTSLKLVKSVNQENDGIIGFAGQAGAGAGAGMPIKDWCREKSQLSKRSISRANDAFLRKQARIHLRDVTALAGKPSSRSAFCTFAGRRAGRLGRQLRQGAARAA